MIHVFIHIKPERVYSFTRLHRKVCHCLKQLYMQESPMLLVITSTSGQSIVFALYVKDQSKSQYITISLPFLSLNDISTKKREI